MRGNVTFFCLIALATAIFIVFVLPYLIDTGHVLLSVPVFLFVALLVIYGRRNPAPRARRRAP